MARMREATKARLRALIDLAPDAFLLADLDGHLVDVNQAACRLLGYSRSELLTKKFTDLVPPEEALRLSETKEHELEGHVDTLEWRYRRKDGIFIPVEVSSRILEGGRWQAFVRDITARKLAEEERKRRLATEQAHRHKLEALRVSALEISKLGTSSSKKTPTVLKTIVDQHSFSSLLITSHWV
jgi:PAS domain S-box-containing protein